ncbi:microsomal glutathione S-transferase 1-like [Copidosoma floridanum]|uniref:microsomal glutathione S-transferase 1-like n=1 Tax=Copidosoma floridanum TaxID=29053 RepID=UPI0006C99D69|nr:microsomal glutathione S-transferase 1-like [Copidosoma floridanum]
MSVLLTLQNDVVFRHFAWWSAAMSAKMLCMMPLIGRQRFRKLVYLNPEDAQFVGKKARVSNDDPDVERPRRAFLNDLENILPWFISTSIFLTTSPRSALAINLMRIFGISRIAHTIVYAVVPIPQPARAIAYFVGYGVTVYQIYLTLLHYY